MSTFWTRLHFSWLWLFLANSQPDGFHKVASYAIGFIFLVRAIVAALVAERESA